MSDFGEGRWIVGIKSHRCEYCYGPVPKGERHYNYRGMYDGTWQNWRMHEECYQSFSTEASYEGRWEFTPGEATMPDRVKQLTQVA